MRKLVASSIAILLVCAQAAMALGGSGPRVVVDSSTTEWTAERYLSARPVEPLPVRSLERDQMGSGLTAPLGGRAEGAPGRPPVLRVMPDFDFYIHPPGARPRQLTAVRELPRGLAAAALSTDGRLKNRGTAALEFSSSRLVPRDARVVYPYSTVGKLFFDKPGGGSGYCSGSVLQRRVVLTAGHCVYTPGKGWHKNFSFVPAFFKGNAPFGTWRAQEVWTTNEWFNGGNVYPNAADFAVLVMRDNLEGQRLGEVTGWLGWKTKSLSPNHVHMLGYPSNLDQGSEMHQVATSSFDCCYGNSVAYGTDMRQGSSGGPWVQNFGVRAQQQNIGRNTQKNRVVGVYSWLFVDDKKILVGGSSIPRAPFANLIRKACNEAPRNCLE
jgi:V8-like Glu-specific endopeptidase